MSSCLISQWVSLPAMISANSPAMTINVFDWRQIENHVNTSVDTSCDPKNFFGPRTRFGPFFPLPSDALLLADAWSFSRMADYPLLQCRRRAVQRRSAPAQTDGLQRFRRSSRLLLLPECLGLYPFRTLDRIRLEGDLTPLAGILRRSESAGTFDVA
jgi:hypothetical protein